MPGAHSLGDARGSQCPKFSGECKSSLFPWGNLPFYNIYRSLRTAGHRRWALPSVHTASPSCHHDSVPTREQALHQSFPRRLLSYFPINNSSVGKSGLSPRKCPAEVLCHVLSHPQAVMTRGDIQAAGKKSLKSQKTKSVLCSPCASDLPAKTKNP